MMRRILSSFILACVLFAFPVATMVNANGAIKFFKVKVKSSSNGTGLYCFQFQPGGILLVNDIENGVGIEGQYVWANKGFFKYGWQAVHVSNGPVGLSGNMGFFGLLGHGIDGGGTTYILKGRRVKEPCGPI